MWMSAVSQQLQRGKVDDSKHSHTERDATSTATATSSTRSFSLARWLAGLLSQ